MRIEKIRKINKDRKATISATVIWENCDRATQEIYFQTKEDRLKDIACNPHAFLVACTLPAMRFGEKRIFIDAEICPELRSGLISAMRLICSWYQWYVPEKDLVRIEAKNQKKVVFSDDPKTAGFLFSGGIDSLATLRANRLNYASEHPGSIKSGLLVYGLEVRELETFETVRASVSILAHDTGVDLIPVYTNIRTLGPENDGVFWKDFWVNEYMGATFAAIAHIFSKRLSSLSINSCHDIPNLMPYGSHPLLNPMYSSSDLRIRHEGIHLSRFEKVRLISDWDLALQHLRVCNDTAYYLPGRLNCGKCEKCVRTMLAFVAAGVLEKVGAFPVNSVDRDLVNQAVVLGANTLPLYVELLKPLEKAGRTDLVQAIQGKLDEFEQLQKKKKWRKKTIEPLKAFDRQYLKGNLKKLKNSFLA
jgi:hypothetical protein